MKRGKTKFKIEAPLSILFFNILIILSSCNGRNSFENKSSTLKGQNKIIPIGDIVSEMDKSIMVIFQDKENNFWFGSKNKGVYKYDGKNLVLFRGKDGLCNNSILGIQEDNFGNIYFDTQGGVSKFDGQNFTTLEIINSSSSKKEWKSAPNDLWFRGGWNKNGPYRYDGKSLYHLEFPKTDLAEKFYSKYPNASYNPYGIYTLYKDRKGTVWFGTASLGVCRYDGKSISWLYEKHLTKTANGGDFGIRSIIEDKDGYFWFCNTRYRYEILPDSSAGNEAGQVNYKRENGIGRSTGNDENDFPYFMSIAEDDNGDLWMLSYDDGVWRNDGKKLIHYPIKDGDTDVLLFSIYKDKQGGLWLGTHNAGVYKFNGERFEKSSIYNEIRN